jgi:FkbM family methyltransferase
LFDWSSQREILFFPEAPGDYVLNVEWMQGSRRGWVTERFSVAIVPASLPVPTQVDLEPELCLWTPSSWEAEMIRHHERGVIDFLRSMIKPGWTIYDIGANLGLFSVVFSQLTTSRGRVYCVEANPLCVYFLRANLAQNKVSNALVFPVALGMDATPVDFTINYGNSNLGVTTLSSIYTQKIGHTITAGAISLDQLIEQFNLLPPKLIKIDIEGAEEVVIVGMKATLQSHRPVLLMELHGEAAARNTLSFLEPFQYNYLDLNTRQQFASAADLIATLGDHIYQVAAFPNPAR